MIENVDIFQNFHENQWILCKLKATKTAESLLYSRSQERVNLLGKHLNFYGYGDILSVPRSM